MSSTQANIEYWFRLLYECFHGACTGKTIDTSTVTALLSHIWLWVIIVGYAVALVSLVAIIYLLIRLFELREREEHYYTTLLTSPEEAAAMNPRWRHIESLLESDKPNDWRTAILEADIMLDEVLGKQGYAGIGVGEKLKSADGLGTVNEAWEAHKVRNQIAHEGSAFNLSHAIAQRTISRYESVFHELQIL